VGDNKIILKNTGEDNSEFVRELEFTRDGITEVKYFNCRVTNYFSLK